MTEVTSLSDYRRSKVASNPLTIDEHCSFDECKRYLIDRRIDIPSQYDSDISAAVNRKVFGAPGAAERYYQLLRLKLMACIEAVEKHTGQPYRMGFTYAPLGQTQCDGMVTDAKIKPLTDDEKLMIADARVYLRAMSIKLPGNFEQEWHDAVMAGDSEYANEVCRNWLNTYVKAVEDHSGQKYFLGIGGRTVTQDWSHETKQLLSDGCALLTDETQRDGMSITGKI